MKRDNNGEEEEEKATWREKEGLLEVSEKKKERIWLFYKKGFLFFHFLFKKANATCPILIGAKRPTFSFDLTSYSAIKEKKLDLFGC